MTMAVETKVLLCAATKWEAGPLARLASDRVTVVKTGIGPANAREALATASGAGLIVSAGFAGALQPGMASGDLVLDVRGLDAELPPMAREIAKRQEVPLHFGRMAHSERVLSQPADKISLGRAERCVAVDMESAALRAAAERLGCPFLAARVVLDALDERLPSAVPAGEGFGDLVSYALDHASELPLMIKLGLRQKAAMARLTDFLGELLPRL